MKIRIGIGLGQQTGPAEFAAAIDDLERRGIDSVWLSEVVSSHQVDPFIGMAHALARTERLKVGTGVAVLPGRHPVRVAKQLASLAGLAPARVLPVFGLRPARAHEAAAFPVPEGRRAAVFDETLRVVRLLLTEDEVTFHGEFFRLDGLGIGARPAKPLDLWLGGAAPAALRRVGRLADGWLASFLTPEDTRRGREAIETAAAEAGREIEADHYGITLAVATDGVPDSLLTAATRRRPDADPADLVATGWPHARGLVERYLDAGLTKFVIRPGSPGTDLARFVDEFTTELLPLQN
ncbi:TIGR03854 family LLM class F420-dependent oxidoreductase [Prauserella sp. PE36]|uniref:TIGR03854 family LLM class F420-dependent oxidoreductase n=1 Tax=Prauserella sp. PE36 TaxID=1504709 RepID=UPI000DE4459F|nr:TIGR03854 family LLM class F420-dependent oxidoreductase [Prauserella sp. PE36]RBM22727.1 TIGR03854 family LLM class F420-dependent oxidoreductase [Prauserella sp. PE36]